MNRSPINFVAGFLAEATQQVKDNRLAVLAQELAIAGSETLRDHFGFTQEQVNDWLGKTLERAKRNREEFSAAKFDKFLRENAVPVEELDLSIDAATGKVRYRRKPQAGKEE